MEALFQAFWAADEPLGSQWWSHLAPPSIRQADGVVSSVTHVSSAVSPRHMFAGKCWRSRCWICEGDSALWRWTQKFSSSSEHFWGERTQTQLILVALKRRRFEFFSKWWHRRPVCLGCSHTFIAATVNNPQCLYLIFSEAVYVNFLPLCSRNNP